MAATYTVALASAAQNSLEENADKITATAVYQIIASEPTTIGHARVNATASDAFPTGVPTRGTDLPDMENLPCIKRTFRYGDAARTVILATLDYDSTQNATISPLDEATVFSSSGEQSEESYYKDASDPPKLALMTNKQRFVELPKRSRSVRVYDVEKNVEATEADAAFSPLENKVNSTSMDLDGRTCDAGTVYASGISLSSVKTRDGVNYKTVKSTLRYHPEGWEQKFESLGLVDINKKPINDGNGHPVDQPWPLTDGGTPAASLDTAGAEIVLKPYGPADLSTLV